MKPVFLSLLSAITLLFSACYYDNLGKLRPESAINQVACDTVSAISYSAQIVPLLDASCTSGCHNGIGSGHDLKTYGNVNADATSGSLLGSVQWGPFRPMPENASSKISDCDIAKIRLWIAQGSQNN